MKNKSTGPLETVRTAIHWQIEKALFDGQFGFDTRIAKYKILVNTTSILDWLRKQSWTAKSPLEKQYIQQKRQFQERQNGVKFFFLTNCSTFVTKRTRKQKWQKKNSRDNDKCITKTYHTMETAAIYNLRKTLSKPMFFHLEESGPK